MRDKSDELTEEAQRNAVEAGLDPARIPRHIAIIMDGNGRWAKSRGLPRLAGHSKGYETARDVVEAAGDLGVKVVTLYTFSSENWSRPKDETEGIMRLVAKAARQELSGLRERGARLIISGRPEGMPAEVLRELLNTVEATRNNTRHTVNLALNYGGRAEIADAARDIAALVAKGELRPEDVDEEMFGGYLYHPELPDPDLLIRTAGELRVSNFLLWEIAYAEIWVTQTLWPDFSRADLVQAIADYQRRVRKFGKTAEQTE